ncbi:zinc-binding dehydrogenase [Rhodococcus pseudokoreensis]|uniref:Zinc-binding dehydrogenase n=1 Tax=Rhodococcus pseudokoreensis TaxID=2811421 RepID=A0A974ZW94_9NOCA|nr:zinc-binding dehydrogenase [Rhodococcus pseudokoreensis]QSE92781.1 zinc-binding dehydrogenase [Rhodococcus pseudokoreensis]
MATTATALVQTAPYEQHFEEIPLPVIEPGAALIRVEANGLCASDIDSFEGVDPVYAPGDMSRYPRINGHEIVGIIEELGEMTSARAGLKVGDRVAVNPFLSCGSCPACRRDDVSFCTGWDFQQNCYGYIPLRYAPGLWGGYSTHVYVHPQAILYRFPADVSPLDATLWNPLAGGIQWAVMNAGTTIGSRVGILGTGQRGMACAAAAKAAGAGVVVTTGLTRDAHKLELARQLGADVTVDVETEDLRAAVDGATGGEGLDIIIDTTPGATHVLGEAIEMLRPGGTLVTVGIKTRTVPDFPIDRVTTRGIRIVGSLGQTHEAYAKAAALIASHSMPLHLMRTHVLGFDHLDHAIELLRGSVAGQSAVNIVVTPTFGN